MNRHTRILVLLAALALALTIPTTASAHTAPTRTQCYTYSWVAGFTTGANVRKARTRCNTKANLHRVTHKCLDVPGSNMGRTTCEGLSRAAIREGHTSWAYNADLHELLRRESTWNPNAINDSSHACGLFQFLPCRWDYSMGPPERVYATAYVQSIAGVRYIEQRYGTPAAALDFHDANNWY